MSLLRKTSPSPTDATRGALRGYDQVGASAEITASA